MSKEARILIADSSIDFQAALTHLVEERDGFRVEAVANDGAEALELIMELRPDILVTELLLREIDGIGLLRNLKQRGFLPPTIVVSGFFSDTVASELSGLGVMYYYPKPCRIAEIVICIKQMVSRESELPQKRGSHRFDEEITEAFLNAGVMPHLQGFRFLREATRRAIEDRSVLDGVTKILYPELAKTFNTTPECIERSMRNALESAWRNGDEERRRKYFDSQLSRMQARPTNSRFILMVADMVEAKRALR